MKKIFIFVICFCFLCINAKASSKFYIGYKIDNIRYVKDKNGTKVYSDFKTIHKSDTNELAYCIQPGVKITEDYYDEFLSYNDRFKIDENKMQKVRLLAKYGYLYQNHTGINWYVATQFLIWRAVMPDTWDIYFVDENNNRLDNMFKDEINEINNLILNHHDAPNILNDYIFNLHDDIIIEDEYNLLDFYKSSSGNIINNKLIINNDLNPGDYKYNLTVIDEKKPVFYNHPTGQDLFTRGEILKNNINLNIHITAGKVKINECDEKTFKDVMIGGTYEILDQDDEVVDEISCSENEECISQILPTGYYKIRVKELSDDYEQNDMIYDVVISDKNTADVSICSLKKDKSINIINYDNSSVVINNINNVNNVYNSTSNTNIVNNYYSKENSDNTSSILTNYLNSNNLTNELANTTTNNNTCIKNNECVASSDIKDEVITKNNINCNNKEIIDKSNMKTISIPNTGKNSKFIGVLLLLAIISYYYFYIRNEKYI